MKLKTISRILIISFFIFFILNFFLSPKEKHDICKKIDKIVKDNGYSDVSLNKIDSLLDKALVLESDVFSYLVANHDTNCVLLIIRGINFYQNEVKLEIYGIIYVLRSDLLFYFPDSFTYPDAISSKILNNVKFRLSNLNLTESQLLLLENLETKYSGERRSEASGNRSPLNGTNIRGSVEGFSVEKISENRGGIDRKVE